MPDENAHIRLAKHNQDLINHLLPDKKNYSDWITTVAFYKALHLVEAVFFCERSILHGRSHENRDSHLKSIKKFEQIYRHYRPLWAAATIARYLENVGKGKTYNNFYEYLDPDEVESKILKHRLMQLERSARKFLTDSGRNLLDAP
jgi:hypothetical protein